MPSPAAPRGIGPEGDPPYSPEPARGAVPPEGIFPSGGDSGSSPLPKLYVNRELSWLEFNRRVLCMAGDASVPLLERLKYLSIYYSNLDEFFMVRIGSLSDRLLLAPERRDPMTGWDGGAELAACFDRVRGLEPAAEACWHAILQGLRGCGVEPLDFGALTQVEELLLWQRFNDEIRPLLSPLVIDRSHPFPFLANREQYVVTQFDTKDGRLRLGVVGVSHLRPCFLLNVDGRQKLVLTVELVSHFLSRLYAKRKVRGRYILRVTRNADISPGLADPGDGADLRGEMQALLKKRKRLSVVRLQLSRMPEDPLRDYLCRRLAVPAERIVTSGCPLDFSFAGPLLRALRGVRNSLIYPPARPGLPENLTRKNVLRTLSERELLLAFPFQSIRPFVDLLTEAADDPFVVSVHISLYRLAPQSKIAAALCRAAENGKKVICVLELRARFDEQNNIDYAAHLEEAGCTILYGLNAYKTHAKLCLITSLRRGRLSYITQIGTGNYNEKTSEQYTDLSLLTPDARVGRDAGRIFEALCLGELPGPTESLWVAPRSFRQSVLALIEREIERQREAGDGAVTIKVNSLGDMEVMQALTRASQAGVAVRLLVRGICCLRPGVPGYTERVRVRSLVGRYLEHSRILQFGMGVRARVFLGSGDLLPRNTERRVEVFVEARAEGVRRQLCKLLAAAWADDVNGWEMRPDGSYVRSVPGDPPLDSHAALSALLGTPEATARTPWLSRLFEREAHGAPRRS